MVVSANTKPTLTAPAAGNSADRLNESDKQDATFLASYQQLCHDFDQIARDQFKGVELEELTNKFLEQHRLYLAQFVLNFAPAVKELLKGTPKNPTDLSKLNENLENDLELLENIECADTATAKACQQQQAGSINGVLADLYRRSGQACYLRVTFNKCRLKREDDRREPVGWLQLALRHDPNNFHVCYWYMITVGRYSETISNARDRTLAGEAFKRAIMRCLKLDPNDPLAHHLLGRYYYHVAGLNWIQRTLVKSFFNFKVEGSYEDAEREFRLAHSLKSDWLPAGLWMARVLLAQDKPKQEIKYWIDLALKMEVREPSTEVERDELIELGRKLRLIH
jgi:hypothetical protein